MTRAAFRGNTLLQLSGRADFNLRLVASRQAVVSARNIQQTPVDVQWRDLPDSWRAVLAAGSGYARLSASDWQGIPQGPASVVADDGQGGLLLSGLEEGRYYLLELLDFCGDGMCQEEQGENCESCPEDCTPAGGQVCCQGEIVDGECCTDADCAGGRRCRDHYCVSAGDGGDAGAADGGEGDDAGTGDGGQGDGGGDSGPDAGPTADTGSVGAGGCGCASGRAGDLSLLLVLLGLLLSSAVAPRRG